jgi:thiamine pyrophosphate-dependent acetolactate synthase large subunit-like protein
MCKEAYQYDRPANFYIEESHGWGLSVALGIAMTTKKRIFVFIGEGDFLRQTSMLIQAKASLCTNIFIVLVDNGVYQSAGNLPNIIESVRSMKGLVFNIGMVVYDFTKYTENSKNTKILSGFMNSLKGPTVILIEVAAGMKKSLPEINLTPDQQLDRVLEVIHNVVEDASQISGPTLNADDIKELDIGGS